MSLFDDYETILLYKSKFALSIAHHLNVVKCVLYEYLIWKMATFVLFYFIFKETSCHPVFRDVQCSSYNLILVEIFFFFQLYELPGIISDASN